jgi:diaminopimelate epimerase
MPKPTNKLSEIPVSNDVKNNPLKLKVKENLFEGHLLNIGNPHIVFFKKISDSDLTDIGPIIEHHKYFPDRINVTFADIQDKKNIKVNVWERGAGKTLACGTAACATAFVAAQTSKSENPVNIHFQKGHLKIEIQPNKSILMTGPVSEPQKIEVNLNED